jgi:hypothetical protein
MKKQVTWLWHGGSSYAVFDVNNPDDVERFPSISAAMNEFSSRLSDPYFPCVYADTPEMGGPSAWCFYGDDVGDYPDFIISCGPRGGVRRDRC